MNVVKIILGMPKIVNGNLLREVACAEGGKDEEENKEHALSSGCLICVEPPTATLAPKDATVKLTSVYD